MARCGCCGIEFDPEDIYDGSWSRFMIDGEWDEVNFLDLYPEPENQTLCEDCAYNDYLENRGAGLDFEFALRTGIDPVDRRRYA